MPICKRVDFSRETGRLAPARHPCSRLLRHSAILRRAAKSRRRRRRPRRPRTRWGRTRAGITCSRFPSQSRRITFSSTAPPTTATPKSSTPWSGRGRARCTRVPGKELGARGQSRLPRPLLSESRRFFQAKKSAARAQVTVGLLRQRQSEAGRRSDGRRSASPEEPLVRVQLGLGQQFGSDAPSSSSSGDGDDQSKHGAAALGGDTQRRRRLHWRGGSLLGDRSPVGGSDRGRR